MKLPSILNKGFFAGIALSLTGCDDLSPGRVYELEKTNINGTYYQFEHSTPFFATYEKNVLTVSFSDSTSLQFIDQYANDLVIESFLALRDSIETEYQRGSHNLLVKEKVKEAQKLYRSYLDTIFQYKSAPLYTAQK